MNLTNRILIAMVAGILAGSLFNLVSNTSGVPDFARMVIDDYLVGGLFDVVGRIFVASLKLLVVPLVLVSLICGASSLGDHPPEYFISDEIGIKSHALHFFTQSAHGILILPGPGACQVKQNDRSTIDMQVGWMIKI